MHDKNGTPIKTGNKVIVEGIIGETYATTDFCNVQILIGYDRPHAADNVQSVLTLNSRQVELLED